MHPGRCWEQKASVDERVLTYTHAHRKQSLTCAHIHTQHKASSFISASECTLTYCYDIEHTVKRFRHWDVSYKCHDEKICPSALSIHAWKYRQAHMLWRLMHEGKLCNVPTHNLSAYAVPLFACMRILRYTATVHANSREGVPTQAVKLSSCMRACVRADGRTELMNCMRMCVQMVKYKGRKHLYMAVQPHADCSKPNACAVTQSLFLPTGACTATSLCIQRLMHACTQD